MKDYKVSLADLCQNLNVDRSSQEVIEHNEELLLLNEKLLDDNTDLESALSDYKADLEAKNEGISDFIVWLGNQRTEGIEADLINIDDVIAELKSIQSMR
jgi:hypothetical protein